MNRSDRRRVMTYEVLRLKGLGKSQRQISRALGISRDLVPKLIEEARARRDEGETALERAIGSPRAPKASKLDPFDGRIRSWLQEDPDLTAVRCHEKLEAEGFVGGYTIVRELLNRLSRETHPEPTAPFMEFVPGQRAEFDWSPYKLTSGLQVSLFSVILCWSRANCLYGSMDQKQGKILDFLRKSFEAWGGVPRECLTDSMPGVVDRWECDQPILNVRYVDFAAHYGYRALTAPRRCPKFKARVERRFRYHEENLLGGRQIHTFEEYVELLAWWLREKAMNRDHPEVARPIHDMAAEEQPRLLPLPAMPYDTRDVLVRLVDIYGYVQQDTNFYPLPDGYVGDRVYVCAGPDRIDICSREAVRIIEHERLPDGAKIRLPQIGSAARKARYDLDALIERLSEWGEPAGEFARGLRAEKRCAGPALVEILGLQLKWTLDDIVAAMRHAMEFRCFDASSVQRILETKFTPRRLEAQIAESTRRQIRGIKSEHPISQRPLENYESLRSGDAAMTRFVQEDAHGDENHVNETP